MTMRVLRWTDLVAQPWRNGGGVTRQIASGDSWRVSIADISADGPFSAFPGMDRVITLLAGPAPTLTIDGDDVTLELLRPHAFDGGATTSARRGSATEPSRDLNLMTLRGACTGSVEIRSSGLVPAGGTVVAVVAQGQPSLDGTELQPYDAVVLTQAAEFSGTGLLAIVRITAVPGRALGRIWCSPGPR